MTERLKEKGLLRQAAFTNDQWITSSETIDVEDPATGKIIGAIPALDEAATIKAVDAAFTAQPHWAALVAKERSDILRRWFELIMRHQDDLATILTLEQGKPFVEAKGEVAYGASFIEWFAEEARRIEGEILAGHGPDRRLMVLRQPIGVVGAITPWNFPSAMITRKAGPALAAGCTMVLKPAEETPFSALALADLGKQAGLPKGVFNIVTGQARPIGSVLTNDPRVRKLTFTGSTETGRTLMKQCAGTIKKLSLELGGNAPFIVFDDADLDAAVEGALIAKFRNNGQTCVCANRIYAQAGIYESFVTKFSRAVEGLVVGPGFDEGVQLGPLINDSATEKVKLHIVDALNLGGKIETGGQPHRRGTIFFEPTVISNVSAEMLVAREETFGPLAPVFRFEDEADVIAQANDTEFGLASYFYANDLSRVWRVSEALEYGMVGINTGLISTAEAPFGGIKQSGLGREGSRHGIEEYLEIKYLCMQTTAKG